MTTSPSGITPDMALEILQQAIRTGQESGLSITLLQVDDDAAVILAGVTWCQNHRTLSIGDKCQKCQNGAGAHG